jgi:hypothetical protein
MADVKTCAACSEPIARKARRYCSKRCEVRGRRNLALPAEKICEWCGETFTRPNGRTDETWAARRFCSRRCGFAFRRRPFEDLVRARFERGPGCWRWKGAVRHGGRGYVTGPDGYVYAYRAVYELLVGPIPDGLQLHHTCGNPSCVNPAHLEPVTAAEHNVITHLGISHEWGGPHPEQEVRLG